MSVLPHSRLRGEFPLDPYLRNCAHGYTISQIQKVTTHFLLSVPLLDSAISNAHNGFQNCMRTYFYRCVDIKKEVPEFSDASNFRANVLIEITS